MVPCRSALWLSRSVSFPFYVSGARGFKIYLKLAEVKRGGELQRHAPFTNIDQQIDLVNVSSLHKMKDDFLRLCYPNGYDQDKETNV